jgi:hypothetical protein
MVCEVCRVGPEGVTKLGALWASEGTSTDGGLPSDDKIGGKTCSGLPEG